MAAISPLSNPSIHSFSTFHYPRRHSELLQRIKILETRMEIFKPTTLQLASLPTTGCMDVETKNLTLPFWFLFKAEDIPERFHITSISDPRLVDVNFLGDLLSWMNIKIQEGGLTIPGTEIDKEALVLFLLLLRSPQQFEACKDFVIGHELAHLSQYIQEEAAKCCFLILGSVSTAVFVFFSSVMPYFAVSLLATALLVEIISLSFLLYSPSMIKLEKDADLIAAKILRSANGGIYFFTTEQEYRLLACRFDPTLASETDSKGNFLDEDGHPPLTERISYLHDWQAGQIRTSSYNPILI